MGRLLVELGRPLTEEIRTQVRFLLLRCRFRVFDVLANGVVYFSVIWRCGRVIRWLLLPQE